jgi:MOSC domain-containing protein
MRLGTVVALWRYPVKSLRGESLPRLGIGPFGVPGDRAFALRDPREGRILSAKRTSELLALAACYPDGPGRPAAVTLADGRRITTDAPEAAATLAAALGRPIELVRSDDAGADRFFQGEGGKTSQSPAFAFVDRAPLHLLTTASLGAIADRHLVGRFDVRRFRPNIVVDCGERRDFLEDALADAVIAIGGGVRLRIAEPTRRCALTTRAVEELPEDPTILRALAEHHAACLGAYATVLATGEIRVGDAVAVRDA